MKIHSLVKEYKCKICQNPREFTQRIHARRHVTTYHPGTTIEDCIIKQTAADQNKAKTPGDIISVKEEL